MNEEAYERLNEIVESVIEVCKTDAPTEVLKPLVRESYLSFLNYYRNNFNFKRRDG